MKNYLENIKTGEKRNHQNSTIAAKRLWNMPFTHRKEWRVVDVEMGFLINGSNTEGLIEFLNPLNWEKCLSNNEAVMNFNYEDFIKNEPSTSITVNWIENNEIEHITKHKTRSSMKRWANNYVGNLGSWVFS